MRHRGKALMVLLVIVAWGLSGQVASAEVARTLEEVKTLNQSVAAAYVPLHEEWVPQMGVHWGVPGMGYHFGPPTPGPALLVMVGQDEEIFGFEIIQPAEQGWHPWFDQPESEPMMFPFGPGYTQHVYIVPVSRISER